MRLFKQSEFNGWSPKTGFLTICRGILRRKKNILLSQSLVSCSICMRSMCVWLVFQYHNRVWIKHTKIKMKCKSLPPPSASHFFTACCEIEFLSSNFSSRFQFVFGFVLFCFTGSSAYVLFSVDTLICSINNRYSRLSCALAQIPADSLCNFFLFKTLRAEFLWSRTNCLCLINFLIAHVKKLFIL